MTNSPLPPASPDHRCHVLDCSGEYRVNTPDGPEWVACTARQRGRDRAAAHHAAAGGVMVALGRRGGLAPIDEEW